jgi:hypothetical protein
MKKHNEYSLMIAGKLFEKTPKTVLAALLVSEYVNRLNLDTAEIDNAILAEWQVLYDNGIIPQLPPKGLENV